MTSAKRNIYIGIGLAVLAVIIWSGNFIAARGVIKQIPPVSLAFYRWVTASILICPIAIRRFRVEWPVVKRSGVYLFWASLTGITLFNTLVYVGAHYTSAINLALIGTTTAPVIAILLAYVFLDEKIGWLKATGLLLCIAGVLFLLSGGSSQNLLKLRFSAGDGWILLAALSFAIYNTLVRKKPAGISPVNYLFVIFCLGTVLLFPFFIWESLHTAPISWSPDLITIILYLGLGTSVIAFLCWNIAIGKLGAGRTALFGNLIPVFTGVEASLWLGEQFTWVHLVSMLLVFSGIMLANRQLFRR
jgi:drug/metabolite transporter (DMT)-like permease